MIVRHEAASLHLLPPDQTLPLNSVNAACHLVGDVFYVFADCLKGTEDVLIFQDGVWVVHPGPGLAFLPVIVCTHNHSPRYLLE